MSWVRRGEGEGEKEEEDALCTRELQSLRPELEGRDVVVSLCVRGRHSRWRVACEEGLLGVRRKGSFSIVA